VASIAPAFTFGQTNRTPAFLNNFPLGKVPAYQGDDGFCLFESNAIAHFLSNESLRGTTPSLSRQRLGLPHTGNHAVQQAGHRAPVKKVLSVLNQHLNTRTFLVGERVSLADISMACSMLWLYKQVLEPSFRQPYPN
ncbi:hypothetical protein NHX12_029845, partial [Muraenolepis orangiensis]